MRRRGRARGAPPRAARTARRPASDRRPRPRPGGPPRRRRPGSRGPGHHAPAPPRPGRRATWSLRAAPADGARHPVTLCRWPPDPFSRAPSRERPGAEPLPARGNRPLRTARRRGGRTPAGGDAGGHGLHRPAARTGRGDTPSATGPGGPSAPGVRLRGGRGPQAAARLPVPRGAQEHPDIVCAIPLSLLQAHRRRSESRRPPGSWNPSWPRTAVRPRCGAPAPPDGTPAPLCPSPLPLSPLSPSFHPAARRLRRRAGRVPACGRPRASGRYKEFL